MKASKKLKSLSKKLDKLRNDRALALIKYEISRNNFWDCVEEMRQLKGACEILGCERNFDSDPCSWCGNVLEDQELSD